MPLGLAVPITAVLGVLGGAVSLHLVPDGSSVSALIVDDPAGWAIVAIVLVRLSGQVRAVAGAVLGLASFVGLDVGWYLAGGGALSASAMFWYAVAVSAGPLVGVAAAWSRAPSTRGAVGGGALAGLLLGDAAVSLRLLGNVPEVAALGVALLGAVLMAVTLVRARTAPLRLTALGVTGAAAGLYFAAWGVIAVAI